jgi:HlyD family secretion protein
MKKILIPGLIVVAALAVWSLAGRGKDGKNTYRFVEIQRGDVESVVSSTGTLQATTTVEVGTQVSGQLAEIYVDFNDRVVKDQLIARIDPTLLQQEVRSAEANLERSLAELEQARREMARFQRLYDGKVATESEFNTAQYQLAVAEASYKSAQVNLERARRNLSYSEIRAPINGVVLERTVDVGQTVAASLSAPKLFLIAEDLSKMEILAAVDESDIGQIHEGQQARFTVQAYPDQPFLGTVKQVRLQSTMQENVVNYTVAVGVDNPDGRLLPGMTTTVEFIVKQESDVLKVANAALRFRPTAEMWNVFRERRQAQAEPAGRGSRPHSSAGTQESGRASGAQSGESQGRGGFARSGTDGGAPGAGGHERSGPAREGMTLLWFLDGDGKVNATPVRPGITDGQSTAIQGPGIREGMQIIAAVTASEASAAINPFQQQQQQGRRGPPTGF